MKKELNQLITRAERMDPMPKAIIQALRLKRDTELDQLAAGSTGDIRRLNFKNEIRELEMRLRDYKIMSDKAEDPIVNERFLSKATLVLGQSMEDHAQHMIHLWQLAGRPAATQELSPREQLQIENDLDELADVDTERDVLPDKINAYCEQLQKASLLRRVMELLRSPDLLKASISQQDRKKALERLQGPANMLGLYDLHSRLKLKTSPLVKLTDKDISEIQSLVIDHVVSFRVEQLGSSKSMLANVTLLRQLFAMTVTAPDSAGCLGPHDRYKTLVDRTTLFGANELLRGLSMRFDALLHVIDPLDGQADGDEDTKAALAGVRPRLLGMTLVDCLMLIAPNHNVLQCAMAWQQAADNALSSALLLNAGSSENSTFTEPNAHDAKTAFRGAWELRLPFMGSAEGSMPRNASEFALLKEHGLRPFIAFEDIEQPGGTKLWSIVCAALNCGADLVQLCSTGMASANSGATQGQSSVDAGTGESPSDEDKEIPIPSALGLVSSLDDWLPFQLANVLLVYDCVREVVHAAQFFSEAALRSIDGSLPEPPFTDFGDLGFDSWGSHGDLKRIKFFQHVINKVTSTFDDVLGGEQHSLHRVLVFVQKLMSFDYLSSADSMEAGRLLGALSKACRSQLDQGDESLSKLRSNLREINRKEELKVERSEIARLVLARAHSFVNQMTMLFEICVEICGDASVHTRGAPHSWLQQQCTIAAERPVLFRIYNRMWGSARSLCTLTAKLLKSGRSRQLRNIELDIKDLHSVLSPGNDGFRKQVYALMNDIGQQKVKGITDHMSMAVSQLAEALNTFALHAIFAVTEHIRVEMQLTDRSVADKQTVQDLAQLAHDLLQGNFPSPAGEQRVREDHLVASNHSAGAQANLTKLRATRNALYEHLESQLKCAHHVFEGGFLRASFGIAGSMYEVVNSLAREISRFDQRRAESAFLAHKMLEFSLRPLLLGCTTWSTGGRAFEVKAHPNLIALDLSMVSELASTVKQIPCQIDAPLNERRNLGEHVALVQRAVTLLLIKVPKWLEDQVMTVAAAQFGAQSGAQSGAAGIEDAKKFLTMCTRLSQTLGQQLLCSTALVIRGCMLRELSAHKLRGRVLVQNAEV